MNGAGENPLPQGDDLEAIWSNSASDVFAVGQRTILHYDGSNWSSTTFGTTETVNGVWGIGSDIFAVGERGALVHGKVLVPIPSAGGVYFIIPLSNGEAVIHGL